MLLILYEDGDPEDQKPKEEIEVVDVGTEDGGDSRSAASREALQSKESVGIKKLEKNNLPSFPSGIDETSESWPKDPVTGKALLQFNL